MLGLESERLSRLGSAVFSEVAQWRRTAEAKGLEWIDLGIGSPDLPPSDTVVQALKDAVGNPKVFGYPTSEGSLRFREAVAEWFQFRFGAALDPEREIVALMGSQDGLSHLAMAITNPGDVAIVPDPGYPIYAGSLVLAGVEPYLVPLREENGFLPKLEEIPEDVLKRAKFMLLSYPSNPLSATADLGFFEEWVRFCKKHELLLVHDLAYSELAFDGFRPPSVLQIPGAKEIAVEFHSLSKSFNMAGCRIAYMVGNPQAVQALRILKSNIDYGVFEAVQEAGIVALREDRLKDGPNGNAQVYSRRRDLFIDGLKEYGWKIDKPKATMFLWAKVPEGWTSRQISREMAESTGVVVIPGDAFGPIGEGYVRIALVQSEAQLQKAVHLIGQFLREHAQR